MRKNNIRHIVSIAFAAALVVVAVVFASCKKSNIYVKDKIPSDVLPAHLYNEITSYMTLYEGTTPPKIDGQFVSRPHILFHASYDPTEDSTVYYDRYIAFTYSSTNGVDFYGKQWDDSLSDGHGGYYAGYYEEHKSKLSITGHDDCFSCYYVTEGYPNGMYAKQSTIFSGRYAKGEGIKDFKVAVILIETSGNPNLQPANSYRILGDADGMAAVENWMAKSSEPTSHDVSYNDNAFNIFRKK